MAPRSCRKAAAALIAFASLGSLGSFSATAEAADGPGGSVKADVAGSGPKLPFRGSTFIFDQSTTPETINPNLQLSRLPSYQWWLSLRPRWYFTDTLSLRLRADLVTEFTNGGSETTQRRQAIWGDVWTDLVYSGIPEFLGIKSSVGLRAIWPASLASQMRGYYTQLGLSINLARDFKTRIGEFGLGLVMVGTHPFSKSTSGGFLADGKTYECMFGEVRGSDCDRLGSAMNPYFTLTTAMSGHYSPIDTLTLNVSYVVVDSFLYGTPDASFTSPSGVPTEVARSDADQRFRQAGWLSIGVDYDATRWLSLGLGYYTFRPIRNANGTIGNPFYYYEGSSRLYFSLTFTLDQVYQSIADRVKKPAPTPTASL